MMRTLEKMTGRRSGRHQDDGTKRCLKCNEAHPVELYVMAGALKKENPYCPKCRQEVKNEADQRRKRRREAFPY